MEVRWTPIGRKTFLNEIDYLAEKWSKKEIENFVSKTEKLIALIQEYPYISKPSAKNKQIRKGFITKNISMFYRVKPRKNQIDILRFWNNKQDPEKLKY